MKILVSACLLGEACRYDGEAKPCAAVQSLAEKAELIPVCPEVLGGLPTPRPSCEIVGGRVLDCNGNDKTEAYQKGARDALRIAQENGCSVAVLKEKSPSCGCGQIHNGKFDGGLVSGNGITAELFLKNGIAVYGESKADAEGVAGLKSKITAPQKGVW